MQCHLNIFGESAQVSLLYNVALNWLLQDESEEEKESPFLDTRHHYVLLKSIP